MPRSKGNVKYAVQRQGIEKNILRQCLLESALDDVLTHSDGYRTKREKILVDCETEVGAGADPGE